MTSTPIVIEDYREAYNGKLFIYDRADGTTSIEIRHPEGSRNVQIKTSELAKLNFIDGLTVKYTEPIRIPKYLGAVVERTNGTGKGMNRWVRVFHDDDSSLPWTNSGTGNSCSNDEVAAVLANGGYEREPEFPTRTP